MGKLAASPATNQHSQQALEHPLVLLPVKVVKYPIRLPDEENPDSNLVFKIRQICNWVLCEWCPLH